MCYLSNIFIISTKPKCNFARCKFVTVVLPKAWFFRVAKLCLWRRCSNISKHRSAVKNQTHFDNLSIKIKTLWWFKTSRILFYNEKQATNNAWTVIQNFIFSRSFTLKLCMISKKRIYFLVKQNRCSFSFGIVRNWKKILYHIAMYCHRNSLLRLKKPTKIAIQNTELRSWDRKLYDNMERNFMNMCYQHPKFRAVAWFSS